MLYTHGRHIHLSLSPALFRPAQEHDQMSHCKHTQIHTYPRLVLTVDLCHQEHIPCVCVCMHGDWHTCVCTCSYFITTTCDRIFRPPQTIPVADWNILSPSEIFCPPPPPPPHTHTRKVSSMPPTGPHVLGRSSADKETRRSRGHSMYSSHISTQLASVFMYRNKHAALKPTGKACQGWHAFRLHYLFELMTPAGHNTRSHAYAVCRLILTYRYNCLLFI